MRHAVVRAMFAPHCYQTIRPLRKLVGHLVDCRIHCTLLSGHSTCSIQIRTDTRPGISVHCQRNWNLHWIPSKV